MMQIQRGEALRFCDLVSVFTWRKGRSNNLSMLSRLQKKEKRNVLNVLITTDFFS